MNNKTVKIPKTISFLQEICENSRLNKRQHFYAADKNHLYNNIFGSGAIIINVMLGSVLFITVSNTLPDIGKWLSGFMAMIAAVCGGVQTFFNFQKQSQGHRKIGNRYLEVQRECSYLLAKYEDGSIELNALQDRLDILTDKYNMINTDGEDFPINDRHYKKVLKKGLPENKIYN